MPARLLLTTGAAALALGALSPAAAWADPPQDPAGNNGTIKIDPYGSTDGHANHPHPGCDFRLQLFGFDADQTGTITFLGQAPTSGAVTHQPLSGTQPLSDDRAGGGHDLDKHFDVRGADLGLTGTPAKQGFHIKVQVDADGAPGGAKTKVFWLSCPAASGSTAGTTAPASGDTGSTTAPATTGAAPTSTATSIQGATSGAATAATTSTTAGTTTAAEDIERLATARNSARRSSGSLAGAVESAETGAPLGSATAASTGRTGAPGGLPFTGLPAAALAGLGLGTVAVGALAVAAGRRRRTSPTA